MKFNCPHCQTPLEADDAFAGASVDFPAYGKALVIVADVPIEEMQVDCPACGKGFVPRQDKPAPVSAGKPQPKKKRTFVVVQIVAAVLFALRAKFSFASGARYSLTACLA